MRRPCGRARARGRLAPPPRRRAPVTHTLPPPRLAAAAAPPDAAPRPAEADATDDEPDLPEPPPPEPPRRAGPRRPPGVPEDAPTRGPVAGGTLPFAIGDDILIDIEREVRREEGMRALGDREVRERVHNIALELCHMAAAGGPNGDGVGVEEADVELLGPALRGMAPAAAAQRKWRAAHGVPDPDPLARRPPPYDLDDSDAERDPDWDGHEVDENFPEPRGEQALPEGVDAGKLQQVMDIVGAHRAEVLARTRATDGTQPASLASVLEGVHGWRIAGGRLHPQIERTAAAIESMWRTTFGADLARGPLPPHWELLDSCDPLQRGDIAHEEPDPPRGSPAYPRLVLENRSYRTPLFRSLHMELVVRQDGFQVLHCVMWPNRDLPLPIFGLDLVVSGGAVRYVIADISPVTANGALPPLLDTAARALRAQFLSGVEAAELPEWGKRVFSARAAAVRPALGAEADLCSMYAVALMRAYIAVAPTVKAASSKRGKEEIDAAHRRYCVAQRSNAKTTTVLERAFSHLGEDAAQTLTSRYIFEVLFDHEYHYGVSQEFKDKLAAASKRDSHGGRARKGANAATEAVLQGVDLKQASKGSLRR